MDASLHETMKFASPKAIAMYEAVNELIKEGKDIHKLKVSEITARAGIGKGTAYEYFSTKEELVGKSMFYMILSGLESMAGEVKKRHGFKEKIFAILEDIENNYEEREMLWYYLGDYSRALYKELEYACQIKRSSNFEVPMKDFLERMMDTALKEGVFTEKKPLYLVFHVFVSQLCGYSFYLRMNPGISHVEMKEFIYQSIVRTLQ